jgi:hypothetical protein
VRVLVGHAEHVEARGTAVVQGVDRCDPLAAYAQAAEQRRLRLASAVHPVRPDVPYGPEIAALRAAAVDLYRRVGADRRWDTRFRRAPLVRQTLSFAADAPLSGLYSLVADVMADLAEAGLHGAGLSRAGLFEAGVTLPRPTRSCVERLAAALEAATPR